MKISMKLIDQYMVLFFNLSPTSIIFINYKSGIAKDEYDKFKIERVNTPIGYTQSSEVNILAVKFKKINQIRHAIDSRISLLGI